MNRVNQAFPFISEELNRIRESGLYRKLKGQSEGIDFRSNDYLGLAKTHLPQLNQVLGSGASRLIAENVEATAEAENVLAEFYQSEAALLLPSGFQANIGLFQAIAGRNDTLLFDELCHASIRDGIRLSHARSFSYRHNNISDLLHKAKQSTGNVFVVTEGLFSMDGDEADLVSIAAICRENGFYLILDEAHSAGILGSEGRGLANLHRLDDICVARMIGLGKAHGCQGGAILGTHSLIDLLINKHRGFIYSTGISPLNAHMVIHSVNLLKAAHSERQALKRNIDHFHSRIEKYADLPILRGSGPIQALVTGGNQFTLDIAERLQLKGFDVSAVRYPTVAKGKERIRLIVHAFNTLDQIDQVLELLNKNIFAKK